MNAVQTVTQVSADYSRRKKGKRGKEAIDPAKKAEELRKADWLDSEGELLCGILLELTRALVRRKPLEYRYAGQQDMRLHGWM